MSSGCVVGNSPVELVEVGGTTSVAAALPPGAVLNMDLSELAFNERVLALAADPDVPLLERLRFVAIVGSNLDEFFRTRVAGFRRQLATHSSKRTLDGLTPEEQLHAIAMCTRRLLDDAHRVLSAELEPQLEASGIRIVSWTELGERKQKYIERRYLARLQSVLIPQPAGGDHPFPHVRNLRPALAVMTRSRGAADLQLVIIQLPSRPPQFIRLPRSRCFIALAEVIRALLPRLLGGVEIVSVHTFRITRSARLEVEEEQTGDLLEAVERAIARRPIQPPVRLEVERGIPDEICDLLLRELAAAAHEEDIPLSREDVYQLAPPVDLYSLREITHLSIPELRYPPFERRRRFGDADSIFEVIRAGEQLVQFPLDSFEDTVERFLAEAVDDPTVVCIKITLYRTSRRSRIIRLLRDARNQGKEVTAVVELLASFDEEQNIRWARSLARHGIHVLYGSPQQKVHAKLALVVRREADQHRHYAYIGTGNLNSATAAGYTDLGLFSAEPALTVEVNAVFQLLEAAGGQATYQHLLVAPVNLRERFFELIDREIRNVQAGHGGHIRAKLNGLADNDMIAALYRASQAGVRMELLVRGICALRPGVPGLSETIRVISILGRFLEHSRIFRFENAGNPEYFIGSADWRGRNLSRRVEVVTPVRRPEHQAELEGILASGLSNPDAWELQTDGSYVQHPHHAQRAPAPSPASGRGGAIPTSHPAPRTSPSEARARRR